MVRDSVSRQYFPDVQLKRRREGGQQGDGEAGVLCRRPIISVYGRPEGTGFPEEITRLRHDSSRARL